jgi:multimeric flavodoxin WrbA
LKEGKTMADQTEPRKGMPGVELTREEFTRRYMLQFVDPVFDPLRGDLGRIAGAAWDGYIGARKSPVTRKAGPGYADPDYELSVDWIEARRRLDEARRRYETPDRPPRLLLINSSPRSENTCPGEMSKTWRLVEIARQVLEAGGAYVDVLDLSRTVSEYGINIHPCKSCFSTAAALCHWPCSCYPNHSLGQAQDWMNDIYPLWVAADGVMIVTPVHWFQSPAPLKAMIDRLVCADGGNPDPTSTHGKRPDEAKRLELEGWAYPRHLEGRVYAVAVHGDAEGAENLRRILSDWLGSMGLVPAGAKAELDRYIGYYEPYATSHEALDRDEDVQEEVRNAARTLLEAARARLDGTLPRPGSGLKDPRPK